MICRRDKYHSLSFVLTGRCPRDSMPTAGRVRGSVSEGDQPVSESVHNAGDILGKLLFALDIALAGDHDALGLGRTGAVHGLSAVANGGSAQAQVLNEAHNALTVLGLDALAAHEELVADLADGLAVAAHHRVGVEVHLRGHGDHQAAGNVLCQTDDLIGEAGDVLLADVGQQQVDLVVARLGLKALSGAGDAAAEQGLVQVGHLDELVFHGAGLLHTVVLSGQSGGADQGVAHAHLAAAVGLTVITGEALHDHTGELILAVEEDVLIGDEYVVQHHQSLLTAELGVADINRGALLGLAGVAGLTAVDHVHTLGVGGAGKADSPILIGLTHGDGGHEDVPVGVDGAGLVALGAADHNAVGAALHHMNEHIGVGLIVGGLGAVTLGVGHGAVHGEVIVLHVGQELLEVLVIVGAVLLVDLIGGGEDGVKGVHAHAALEAGSGLLAQQALHFHLVHQVLGGLMQMGEAVDGVAGEAGFHGHEIGVLGILRQRVGHSHAVDRGTDHGVIHPVLDLLAEHVDAGVQLPQGLNVFLGGHQCHFLLSS